MERELKPQKRKREDDNIINESNKQEYPHGHEFCDGINGVFDFPWLKEGVVFKGDDQNEHKFSPCSYLDEAPGIFPAYFEQSCSLNLCVSPTLDANFYDTKLDDDDGFWSLLVDDLSPVDCIWNFVIDQPLDMGFNKGL